MRCILSMHRSSFEMKRINQEKQNQPCAPKAGACPVLSWPPQASKARAFEQLVQVNKRAFLRSSNWFISQVSTCETYVLFIHLSLLSLRTHRSLETCRITLHILWAQFLTSSTGARILHFAFCILHFTFYILHFTFYRRYRSQLCRPRGRFPWPASQQWLARRCSFISCLVGTFCASAHPYLCAPSEVGLRQR